MFGKIEMITEVRGYFLMRKPFTFFIFLILTLFGCKASNDYAKLKSIKKEVGKIITQKETLAEKLGKTPKILTPEYLNRFPENRSELKLIAIEKKRLYKEMIKLDKLEVKKLKEAEILNLEESFSEYLGLMRKLQESTIKLWKFKIQSYDLIFNKNITTQKQLKNKLSKINEKHKIIDSAIKKLEELQRKNPNHY